MVSTQMSKIILLLIWLLFFTFISTNVHECCHNNVFCYTHGNKITNGSVDNNSGGFYRRIKFWDNNCLSNISIFCFYPFI